MKETLDLRGLNFEEGYIAVIDKPLSWTSTDVVRKIKSALRRLGYRKIKVGHAGTLDPLASGILLVCIGRATKMVDALQAEEKVQLVGFGSFETKKRAARTGLNPRTKETVDIPASKVPAFKAGKALKDAVAE